jgi:hypothetical protein
MCCGVPRTTKRRSRNRLRLYGKASLTALRRRQSRKTPRLLLPATDSENYFDGLARFRAKM